MDKIYWNELMKGNGPEYVLLAKDGGKYKLHTVTNNLITLVVKLNELWDKVKKS